MRRNNGAPVLPLHPFFVELQVVVGFSSLGMVPPHAADTAMVREIMWTGPQKDFCKRLRGNR